MYPRRLREIYDAPPILYLKGSLDNRDEGAVAVVGSRNSSRYGLISADGIARGLAARGITVVSGMARGIDSARPYRRLERRWQDHRRPGLGYRRDLSGRKRPPFFGDHPARRGDQ